MIALAMEYKKTRYRRIWLIIVVMVGIQALWALWAFRHARPEKLEQAWLICLYQFPMLNAVIMPIVAAVVASRLSDIEHKGLSWKLLRTIQPARALFDAKFLCGASYLTAAAVAQVLLVVVFGTAVGFIGGPPMMSLLLYLLFTVVVNLTVLVFQQTISLLFVNQLIPLSVGIVGSFCGLFLMFFPPQWERFLIWGYYGVLMLVRLDWNDVAKTASYCSMKPDWVGFATLVVLFVLIYCIGREIFVRKEV